MNEVLENLIPHKNSMFLLDSISDRSKTNFTVQVRINNNSFLCKAQGIPSYCGIEYMAQSIAAYNSLHFKNSGGPQVGFIIGVRDFHSTLLFFEQEALLNIRINPVLIMEHSGVFDCEIIIEEKTVAKGRITAYIPSASELEELKETIYE